MASPITIGTTAITIATRNTRRSDIRFQNTGATIIYIKKIPAEGLFTPPSATDYEVLLAPPAALTESGEAFITDSISSFAAVSSAAAGVLAIYETNKF